MTQVNGQARHRQPGDRRAIDPTPVVGLRQRKVELIAPEVDHVNETLATPVPMTDIHYADMTEPEGYLDNAAELGPLANRVGLQPDTSLRRATTASSSAARCWSPPAADLSADICRCQCGKTPDPLHSPQVALTALAL